MTIKICRYCLGQIDVIEFGPNIPVVSHHVNQEERKECWGVTAPIPDNVLIIRDEKKPTSFMGRKCRHCLRPVEFTLGGWKHTDTYYSTCMAMGVFAEPVEPGILAILDECPLFELEAQCSGCGKTLVLIGQDQGVDIWKHAEPSKAKGRPCYENAQPVPGTRTNHPGKLLGWK